MVEAVDKLWSDIVKFIETEGYASFWFFGKKTIPITRDTRIEGDLGITGDDAEEFLVEFMKKFPFELGDFDISNYFEGEGFWPLPTFKKRKEIKPLTLGMLEQAVKAGVWNTSELEAGFKKDTYHGQV